LYKQEIRKIGQKEADWWDLYMGMIVVGFQQEEKVW